MKEIETKILEFNEASLRKTLDAMGAKYLGKSSMRRMVFFLMLETDEQDEILRVRTDGKRTTLTWKYRNNKEKKLDNTEEVEIEVYDFDKTVELMSKHCKGKKPCCQENKTEKWLYKNIEVAICTWPLIPKFLELEGKIEEAIKVAIKELEIKGEEIGNDNLAMIFERYGQKGKDSGELRFD